MLFGVLGIQIHLLPSQEYFKTRGVIEQRIPPLPSDGTFPGARRLRKQKLISAGEATPRRKPKTWRRDLLPERPWRGRSVLGVNAPSGILDPRILSLSLSKAGGFPVYPSDGGAPV